MRQPNISFGWTIGVSACVAVLAAPLAVVSFERSQDPKASSFQSPLNSNYSVRLGGAFDTPFAGEMVAVRQGLFEQQGLHVQLRPAANSDEAIDSVVRGVDQIGVTSSEKFLMARARGSPIVAFLAGLLKTPVVFYSSSHSNIRSPTDLSRKKVGYQTGRDTAIVYEAMMAVRLLSRSTVQEILVGHNPEPLISGDIDVWPGHIGVESYEFDQRGFAYNVIQPGEYGIHWPGTVYFGIESKVRRDPAGIQKLVNGIVAGWQSVYSDYDQSVPLLVAFDPGRLEFGAVRFRLEQQRSFVRPYAARIGEFDEEQWNSLRTSLLQLRLIQGSVDLTKSVTYEFIQEAYRQRNSPTRNQ